jgi:hypothetical protein
MLGSTFAKLHEDATAKHYAMMHDPYEWVRERMVRFRQIILLRFLLLTSMQQNGTAKPSLVRDFLAQANSTDKDKELVHLESLGMAFIGAQYLLS